MTQSDMAKRLYQARKMQTQEEVKQFEEAREALVSSGNTNVLSDLFAAFDDSTEQHEVMFGLVHDVESYEPQKYLTLLARATPKMLRTAKEWAKILHMRLLNSRKHRLIYRNVVRSLPPKTRSSIASLLEEIAHSEPEFRKRIQYLLK